MTMNEPEFVVVGGIQFAPLGKYTTPSGLFKGLVVHYTVSGRTAASAKAVLSYLASQGLGCMVMDEDGLIYVPENWNPLTSWGHHAGVSSWQGEQWLSDKYAGMEICCWGKGSSVGPFRSSQGEANISPGTYQAFTASQERSLIRFCDWALKVNPEFSAERIVGHDEIRAAAGKPGQKTDPGASLSKTMPDFRMLF